MNNEKFVLECEKEIKKELNKIDEIVYFNSKKVIEAFQKNNLSEYHFNSTTGYGYNDIGRDAIEKNRKNIC